MQAFFFLSSRRRHTMCALVTRSSDVCSSDLPGAPDDPGVDRRVAGPGLFGLRAGAGIAHDIGAQRAHGGDVACAPGHILPEAGLPGALDHHDLETRPQQIAQAADVRSEENTSELQSLMRSSYAVFCLKKQK